MNNIIGGIFMADKTNGNGGQHNSYVFTDSGHEHSWYNPTTGTMGWHGDNCSDSDKQWAGQRAGDLHIGEGK